MANALTQSGRMVQIVFDGATDITMADFVTLYGIGTIDDTGLYLRSIKFVPSAANDVVLVRNKSITGIEIFRYTSLYESDIGYQELDPSLPYFPCVDASDLTLGTAANAKLIMELV